MFLFFCYDSVMVLFAAQRTENNNNNHNDYIIPINMYIKGFLFIYSADYYDKYFAQKKLYHS